MEKEDNEQMHIDLLDSSNWPVEYSLNNEWMNVHVPYEDQGTLFLVSFFYHQIEKRK